MPPSASTTAPWRSRRRRIAVSIAVVAALGGVAAVLLIRGGNQGGAGGVGGPIDYGAEVPSLPVAGADPGGGCEAEGSAPPGDPTGKPAGTPFGSAGARQVPGPATTVTSIPNAPVSVVVSSPPNPDERSAAAQVSGTGSPTPTYGTTPSRAPSTSIARSTTTSAPPVCEGGL